MTGALREIDKKETIHGKLASSQNSPLNAYKELTVGEASFSYFLLYELLTLLIGGIPGALGFLLRRKFYPLLFKQSGKGLIIGRNVVLRHPRNIVLGDSVTIDDYCVLDGRGSAANGIVLEDNVILNRNCLVLAKAGAIRLGQRTSIGSNSVIVSMDGVELGKCVLVAGGCYISAGAYHIDDLATPIMDQGTYSKGPITIHDNVWIGTGATILDGMTVGTGVVIGAGAVITKNIPDNAIVAGVPAKVLRMRE